MMRYKKQSFDKYIIYGLIIFIELFSQITVRGQNSLSHLFEESNSPTQTEFMKYMLRPESDMQNAFLDHPSLIHLMIEDHRYFFNYNPQSDNSRQKKVFTAIENSYGKEEGDYLPFQGKQFNDISLRANGYLKSENATLFGKANFVNGKHKGYDWNTLRYAELYWPYIVADSTGGNFSYEKYNVMGAYSFRFNEKIIAGVSGEFKGDFAYRQNDPRIEDITTWLTLKSGITYALKQNLFSANIEYTLHKQQMDLHHFRTGQFAGFFIEYGFGMFDYIHSPIFRSMKQQQHMNNYGISLAFNSNPLKTLQMNAKLKYDYNVMNTEENIYKINLYRAITQNINLSYGLLWNNSKWGIVFFSDVKSASKSGRENLFERYVSSVIDGVNVYDYKKMGHQERYKLNIVDGKANLKVSYYFQSNYTFSLLAGLNYFMRDETYKERNYQIKNVLLIPSIGTEFYYKGSAFDFQFKGVWSHRSSIDNKYHVGINMERHTEFQHAFTPYAYYANNSNILTLETTLSKQFTFGTIGIQGQLLYTKGNRLSDVYYDSERYDATIPSMSRKTISVNPDVHNTRWAKISLFAFF